MPTTKPAVDGQKARSIATQQALMLAAEKLIARKGIENVSIREIVKAAGQKNESALQYHFKNLKGLVRAIQRNRAEQVHEKRTEELEALESRKQAPTLADLCHLMVAPSFMLARSNPDYRRYIIAFSHELALTEESALALVNRQGGGGASGRKTGELLRTALPHLDDATYGQRMDSAVRLVSISMGRHARQKNAFRGTASDFFLSSIIDALVGLLSVPVSPQTKTLARRLAGGSG